MAREIVFNVVCCQVNFFFIRIQKIRITMMMFTFYNYFRCLSELFLLEKLIFFGYTQNGLIIFSELYFFQIIRDFSFNLELCRIVLKQDTNFEPGADIWRIIQNIQPYFFSYEIPITCTDGYIYVLASLSKCCFVQTNSRMISLNERKFLNSVYFITESNFAFRNK